MQSAVAAVKPPAGLRPALFIAALLPFVYLLYRAFSDDLGANPIEEITHFTGDWTLYLLLITLAVTPLRRLLGWTWLLHYRRMLGLFAFFYACMHFLTYLVLDQFFDLQEIVRDVIKRPYITVGFTAFVLLFPLALTSTNNMMRRLGRRWKPLHRLVYLITLLGVLHFLWLTRADVREPLLLGAILLLLLILRLPRLPRLRRARETA